MFEPKQPNNSQQVLYLRLLREGKITQEQYDRIMDKIDSESNNAT